MCTVNVCHLSLLVFDHIHGVNNELYSISLALLFTVTSIVITVKPDFVIVYAKRNCGGITLGDCNILLHLLITRSGDCKH